VSGSGPPPGESLEPHPPPPASEPSEAPGWVGSPGPASDDGAPVGTGPPGIGRLLGSASLLSLGNILSRLMGFVRDRVLATTVGPGLELDAFLLAAKVPTHLYTLLIGGQLSAALVPVLAAYRAGPVEALRRAASVLLSVAAVVTGLAALGVYAFADPIAGVLADGMGAEGITAVAGALRILAPSALLFGIGGVLTGLLLSQERFRGPALAGAVYNLGVIATLWLAYGRLGFVALPIGVVLGSGGQLLLLALGARDLRLRPSFDLRHRALRRVLVLYAPIALGLLATDVLLPTLDGYYSSHAGLAARSWLDLATRLTQLPHGLITVAISLAILPTLAAAHARGEGITFARTLSRGGRMVMALTLPAAVGLAALADPVTGLAFQAGAFGDADRLGVALALRVFLLGLPFAAIDWPLNYAFYARGNTWLPALVGLGSFVPWWLVAQLVGHPADIGVAPGAAFAILAAADSAKHLAHAGTMYVLVRRNVGPTAVAGFGRTTLLAGLAALGMGAVVLWMDGLLAGALQDGISAWAIRVGLGAGVGAVVYAALAARLGVAEIGWFSDQVRARLRR